MKLRSPNHVRVTVEFPVPNFATEKQIKDFIVSAIESQSYGYDWSRYEEFMTKDHGDLPYHVISGDDLCYDIPERRIKIKSLTTIPS